MNIKCPLCGKGWENNWCEHYVLSYDRTFPYAGANNCPLELDGNGVEIDLVENINSELDRILLLVNSNPSHTLPSNLPGRLRDLVSACGSGALFEDGELERDQYADLEAFETYLTGLVEQAPSYHGSTDQVVNSPMNSSAYKYHWASDAQCSASTNAILAADLQLLKTVLVGLQASDEEIAELLSCVRWVPVRDATSEFLDGATTDDESLLIILTYFADQRWGDLGVSREVAIPALRSYIQFLIENEGETQQHIVNLYFQLQMNLMARRVGDVISIQQHPAFSTQGQRNLDLLTSCFRHSGAEGLVKGMNKLFPASGKYNRPMHPVVVFKDDEGDTSENAVIIQMPPRDAISGLEYLTTNVLGVHSESWYLCYKYGYRGKDWTKNGQLLVTNRTGRSYDVIEITTSQGQSRQIYFDVTEFIGIT